MGNFLNFDNRGGRENFQNLINGEALIRVLRLEKFPEINYVIVNFYPFDKLNFKSKAEAIELIDIGGPSLIRSAAKNYNSITAITNKKDYAKLVNELKKNNGYTTLSFRKKMANL